MKKNKEISGKLVFIHCAEETGSKFGKIVQRSFYCIHDKNTKFHLNFLSVLFKIRKEVCQ